jgi:hypothetical protein
LIHRWVFFKAQQGAERCAMNRRLAHRGQAAADIDSLNSEGGPTMAQPCACNELANGCASPMGPIPRHSKGWVRKRSCGHARNRLHRSSHVGISLKVLIDHWASPTGCWGLRIGFPRSLRCVPCAARYGSHVQSSHGGWHEGCVYAE